MIGEGGDADTAAGPQLSGCADPRSGTAPSPGTSAAPSLTPAFAAASGRCQPALIAPGLGRMPQAAVGQAVTPNTAAQPQPAAPPLSELNSGLAACKAAGTAAAAQPAISTQTVPAVPSEHAATMQWLAAAVAATAQKPAAPAVPVPVPVQQGQQQQQQQQQQQAADTLARALPGAAADAHAAAQPAAPLQAATLQEAVAAASRVPLSVARSAAARRGPTPALLTAQNRASGTGRGVSLYNGVCFDRRKQRWFSQIQQAGKRHFLGYHPSEEEAAQAYDRAALQLYGSQAQLNFPLDAVQSPTSHNTTAGTGLHGSSNGTGSLPVGHARQHIQPVVGAATTAEAAASQQPNMAAALLAALLGVPATMPVAPPQPPQQPQPQQPVQQARPQAVRQASPQRPISPLSALQQLATLQQLQLLEQQLNPQREQQQEEEEQKQQPQQQQPPPLPQQSAQQQSSPQPQQPGPSSPSPLPGSDAGPGRLGSQIGRKRHHSELESEVAERQAP